MDGLALPLSELPLELIERYELSRLIHERGGEKELRFLRQTPRAILPVRHQGLLRIVAWGSRSGKLPRSGYIPGKAPSKRGSGRGTKQSPSRFPPLPGSRTAYGSAFDKACGD
jgi:hypothetical protein